VLAGVKLRVSGRYFGFPFLEWRMHELGRKVSREAIEAMVVEGRRELAPMSKLQGKEIEAWKVFHVRHLRCWISVGLFN